MAKLDVAPQLAPGAGFHLEGDGNWDVAEIPPNVVADATYSGELSILGYKCAVFEMPDGDQWAQKAPGVPAPKEGLASARPRKNDLRSMAERVASRSARVRPEEAQVRSVRSLMEELQEAEKALDKAAQFGRSLSTEPSFEWILDQLDANLGAVREFRKSARGAFEYLLRTELGADP